MDNDSERAGGKCGRATPVFAALKKFFIENLFLVLLLLGIIIGIGMGIGIRTNYPERCADKRFIMYLEFPGKLLLRMLKMLIIPLIVSSLISGMAAIPSKAAGRLGGFAVLYYLITTFMAVLLGILLVSTIKPGNRRAVSDDIKVQRDKLVQPEDAILDLIRNSFPDNIVGAAFQKTQTEYTKGLKEVNVTNENNTYNLVNKTVITGFSVKTSSGTNVLGLVVFSVVLGIIIGQMGESGRALKAFMDGLQEAIISMVKIIIWYSPIGIMFLIAGRICGMKDPAESFIQLGWYMMTVLLGLAIHEFITLAIIYFVFTRRNPFRLMLQMSQALLTALGTASSSATLPVTLHCLEEKAGVDKRVSRFVLPVGATINMDGTALYEAVASIFIAQVNGYHLDAGQLITVSLTATAAAIGAAGVPEAGLVTMVIVLTAIGLPTDDIGLIFTVDWLLDRFRTQVNVWGDSVGAGIVEKLAGNQLDTLGDAIDNDTKDKGEHNNGYTDAEHMTNTML